MIGKTSPQLWSHLKKKKTLKLTVIQSPLLTWQSVTWTCFWLTWLLLWLIFTSQNVCSLQQSHGPYPNCKASICSPTPLWFVHTYWNLWCVELFFRASHMSWWHGAYMQVGKQNAELAICSVFNVAESLTNHWIIRVITIFKSQRLKHM